jgi:hypothetical protein
MAYEAQKLASSRNGDLAKLRTSALKQAASGARFYTGAGGNKSVQALRDMADEAALAGDDDLCAAIKTSLRGGELSPAQFRTMMAAAKKAECSPAKADATSTKPRAPAQQATSGASARTVASPPSPSLTGYAVQIAATPARQAEHDRWAGVILSTEARGKQIAAASMLVANPSASVDDLRRRLAKFQPPKPEANYGWEKIHEELRERR